MSECYTYGGDTLQKVDHPDIAGQTFRVEVTHILEYIDLELRGPLRIPEPVIEVFQANAGHEPFGPCLSRSRYVVEQKCNLFTIGRARFSMTPFELDSLSYYAIVVSNYPPVGGNSAWWQYDQGDAAYPRGIRISSPDGGTTWTKHHNDDFMFAEFGTPPLPKPEPPPPIEHFAPIKLTYTHFPDHIIISLATSVPCHLICYYTDKKPLKHAVSRVIRGLTVPWSTYFCFVSWKEIGQTELGDTLFHTFKVEPWEWCQVKWFTFRGNIDADLSPSIGPIFMHHHDGLLPRDVILRPNAPGDLCTIIGGRPYGCPDHYLCVNEEIPDEDTSIVGGYWPWGTQWKTDLYHLQTEYLPFNEKVTFSVRVRSYGTRQPTRVHKYAFKTHGVLWQGPSFASAGPWTTFNFEHPTNPSTGEAWTQEEINDLQAGVACSTVAGIGWAQVSLCTQVYITVRRAIIPPF